MKRASGPTTREYGAAFGDRPVKVTEFNMLEAVPHLNAGTDLVTGRYVETLVTYTTWEFEQATMSVRRPVPEPVGDVAVGLPPGKPYVLEIQAIDQYGYQREFGLRVQRVRGTNTFRWQADTYLHPFHTPDQYQDVDEDVALRFCERLIELAERYPSLQFNNSGFTQHTPPRFRPRHEGFVRWHTMLLNGATVSAELLD